jgi:hypothetical protein
MSLAAEEPKQELYYQAPGKVTVMLPLKQKTAQTPQSITRTLG